MPIDDKLAESIRTALTDVGAVTEVKMFGGIGFMLNGNLLAGASTRGLLLRVGKERAADATRAVKSGIRGAVAYVGTLPPKKKGKRK